MSIVNTTVPITSASCEAVLAALANTYPFCRLERIGVSDFQRPISALTLGSGERRVLYTAAHHANEWITALVLLQFAQELCQAYQENRNIFGVSAKTLLGSTTISLVPMVNPDGVDLVVGEIAPDSPQGVLARGIAGFYPSIPFPQGWKANLVGTDLNLQYPAGWLEAREIKFSQGFTRPGPRDFVGRAPLNQAETIALAEYTENFNPDLVLAYHAQGKEIYWQFRNIVIPGARELGERLAAVSGYALADTPYNSSFAGYKDWFIQFYRRPGYTIEVGLGENPLPLSQFPEIYRDNLGILITAATG